jgi:hypothetical protein
MTDPTVDAAHAAFDAAIATIEEAVDEDAELDGRSVLLGLWVTILHELIDLDAPEDRMHETLRSAYEIRNEFIIGGMA